MKELVLLALLAATCLLPGRAAALSPGREVGIGIVLGEPSGVLAQFFMTRKTLLDVTAAWSFDDWFMVACDYQIYNYIADAPPEWRWYYGVGGYAAFPENDDGIIGVRVPLGISYSFPRSFIDVWLEVDPALKLAPKTEAAVQGGLGVTFWLK